MRLPCGTTTEIIMCHYMPLYLYSRTPVTRTLKGHEKELELAGIRIIWVEVTEKYGQIEGIWDLIYLSCTTFQLCSGI